MATTDLLHGTFVLRREFRAAALDVQAAFIEPERRSDWVRLPGKADPANVYCSRPGVTEVLRSSMRLDDRTESIERRTRLIDSVPGRRVVFTYEAVVDDVVRWVSLVSVGLEDVGPGSALTWTEQYTMLVVTGDGSDDTAHLRGGTELHLNGLGAVVNAHSGGTSLSSASAASS